MSECLETHIKENCPYRFGDFCVQGSQRKIPRLCSERDCYLKQQKRRDARIISGLNKQSKALSPIIDNAGNNVMCWMCGSGYARNYHHALPRCVKPKNNIKIPLCVRCHNWLHHAAKIKHNYRDLAYFQLDHAAFVCSFCGNINNDLCIEIKNQDGEN